MLIKSRKIYIAKVSPGCHSSSLDCNDYKRIFEAGGFSLTPDIRKASVILVCACIAGTGSEADTFAEIEKVFRNKRADAEVVVGGCLTGNFREKLKAEYNCLAASLPEISLIQEHFGITPSTIDSRQLVDMRVGLLHKEIRKWQKIHAVLYLLNKACARMPIPSSRMLGRFINTAFAYSKGAYLLRCASGCPNNCSYCEVRNARGRLRSNGLKDIILELELALDKGYRHFVLVADDLSSYGFDCGSSLPLLLEAVFSLPGDFTIELPNLHPKHVLSYLDDFIKAIKPGRIRCIHYDLQSGSDRILKLMNRDYTAKRFIMGVSRILEKDPNISLRTDIIVGFPGEDETDLQETLKVIKAVPFECMDITPFEERFGAPATHFPGQSAYSLKIKRKRMVRAAFVNTLLRRWLSWSARENPPSL